MKEKDELYIVKEYLKDGWTLEKVNKKIKELEEEEKAKKWIKNQIFV